MSFYTAQLTGSHPFSSFTVPGVTTSVVIGRRPARLDEKTKDRLVEALKKGEIPNVKREDVLIEEVDGPKVSADTPGSDARADELEGQLADLTRERDELRARADELEGQLAESDATALASGILDSFTVPELTKAAKARGVDVKSDATKADVIGALVAPPAA